MLCGLNEIYVLIRFYFSMTIFSVNLTDILPEEVIHLLVFAPGRRLQADPGESDIFPFWESKPRFVKILR